MNRLLVVLTSFLALVQAQTYLDANEWLRIDYLMNPDSWNETTSFAQDGIVNTAHWLAAQGPWTVTTKAQNGILPPTNNSHDYLSWRPYFWANCSNVHNTTELSQTEIWTLCNYDRKDGQMAPDLRLVNDTQDLRTMTDAVFYNTLAYAITEEDQYAANAVNFIYTWFLNPETYMTPNLDYSQVLRGPTNPSQKGSHTGVLDMKGFTKVSSCILYFRKTNNPHWTADYDSQMNEWSKTYIQWLTTSSLALEERKSDNNHGSFYFAQLAAFQVLVGDLDGAKTTINDFFNGIFLEQIVENGEQPLEAARTHPYHYRAYNAAAVLVICEISKYLGIDGYSKTTKHGATIQDAVDHAMLYEPDEEEIHGAFTPTCSMSHVPGFIGSAEELKSKGVDGILLISVNDPFVMKAWAKSYPDNRHVKFLADGSASYTHALGLELDLSEKGLGIRSRRFALLVDNLVVKVANIEEGGAFTISGAEEILKAL